MSRPGDGLAARALSAARDLGRATLRDLAAFALPQRCPGCGAPAAADRVLCDACRALVPRLAFPLCARCSVLGRDPAGCAVHPGFAVWSAWVYEERAALVVRALKYESRPSLAGPLAREMAAALPADTRPDLIVPVPLHPARRRERGYNQAACLADGLARALGSPMVERALARVRATRAQARLDPRARRANLRGAFRVEAPEVVRGRRVLLVDDVMTTGATLECALAVLGRAGAIASAATLAWAS